MAAQPPPDKPAWLDQPPAWLAQPPAAPAPAPPMPQVGDAPQQAPAWSTPPPRSSRLWIYLAGALALILIVGGGIYVRGQILAMQAANDQTYIASSPTPFLSDYERADRFMNVQMTPAFAALVGPLQSVESDCSPKSMTAPCKPDLIALDKGMIAGETAFEQGDIPICIAREVNQFKYDWQGMEQGLGLAISGYSNNSYDLYLQGIVKFAEIAQYLKPDMDRITAAENTCSKATR